MTDIYNTIYANIWLAVGGSVLIFVLFLINKLLEYKSISLLTKFKKILKRKHKPIISNNMIKIFDIINSELAVIKKEMKSDRAFIFEFHNGDYFVSKNSRYKLSRTYEKVSYGISLESINLQSIDVTLVWDDYLKPFFVKVPEDNLPFGFFYIKDEENDCSVCKSKDDTILIDVNKMDSFDGPSKIMLENQGVKYSILTAIVSSSGVIYGILGFDYINTTLDLKDVSISNICRLSKQIAMLWESDETLKTDALKYKLGDYKKLD